MKSKQKIFKIIEKTIEDSKDFSIKNGDEYCITYKYLNKLIKIYYNYDYNNRLGFHVVFSTKSFPSFTYKHNSFSITEKTIQKNNKLILTRLRKLAKKINTYQNLQLFIEKEKKDILRRIKNYIIKDVGIPKNHELNISCDPKVDYYKFIDSKKYKLFLRNICVSICFNYNNINYCYVFSCNTPSEWSYPWSNNIKNIKIIKCEKNFNNKKISNIIRYAKLKNIIG